MNHRLTLLTLASLIVAAPVRAKMSALETSAVTIGKELDNKIEIVKAYLKPRLVHGQCKIWVFFTDKK